MLEPHLEEADGVGVAEVEVLQVGLHERGHDRELRRDAALLGLGGHPRGELFARRVVARVVGRGVGEVGRTGRGRLGRGCGRRRGGRLGIVHAGEDPGVAGALARCGLGLIAGLDRGEETGRALRRRRRRGGGRGRRDGRAPEPRRQRAAARRPEPRRRAARRPRARRAAGSPPRGASSKPTWMWFWCAASVKKTSPEMANGDPISLGRMLGSSSASSRRHLARQRASRPDDLVVDRRDVQPAPDVVVGDRAARGELPVVAGHARDGDLVLLAELGQHAHDARIDLARLQVGGAVRVEHDVLVVQQGGRLGRRRPARALRPELRGIDGRRGRRRGRLGRRRRGGRLRRRRGAGAAGGAAAAAAGSGPPSDGLSRTGPSGRSVADGVSRVSSATFAAASCAGSFSFAAGSASFAFAGFSSGGLAAPAPLASAASCAGGAGGAAAAATPPPAPRRPPRAAPAPPRARADRRPAPRRPAARAG